MTADVATRYELRDALKLKIEQLAAMIDAPLVSLHVGISGSIIATLRGRATAEALAKEFTKAFSGVAIVPAVGDRGLNETRTIRGRKEFRVHAIA